MKKGVDVSANNGTVDWNNIKNNGYEFAIIRCGYGSDIASQDDKQYINNVKKCEELGIPYGIYLYSYALNINSANSEAEHVLRLLKQVGNNFKLGVWFDMEDADGYKKKHGMPSNSTLVDICYTFCDKLKKAGYYTGIYASLSWFNNQLNSTKLDSFDKWVAQWNSRCTYNRPYSLWQYTSDAIINGKRFDANYLVKAINDNTEAPTKEAQTAPTTGDSTIRDIQAWLNANYGTRIAVDGIYGSNTKKALVKALQHELNMQYHKGLVEDGIFGARTKAACPNVKKGARGNITKLIQAMLYCRGYNTNGVDGIFGQGTENAVRKFQSTQRISSDGIVGRETFDKLFR